MDESESTQLANWYKAEMLKVSQEKDLSTIQSKMAELSAQYQVKLKALQEKVRAENVGKVKEADEPEAVKSEMPKATETKPSEAVKFIPLFVEPYYSGPQGAGQPPKKVKVNESFDSKLMSTQPADILQVQAEIKKDNSRVTPMTFFVLAARLYDVGARKESVFWFYAAKDRVAAVRAVAKPELVATALDASSAFDELLGPTINGYAFCDIDFQLSQMKAAAEWSQKNPYSILLDAKIHKSGADAQKLLTESALDRLKQVSEATQYFSDNKIRESMSAQRKAKALDKKFCW